MIKKIEKHNVVIGQQPTDLLCYEKEQMIKHTTNNTCALSEKKNITNKNQVIQELVIFFFIHQLSDRLNIHNTFMRIDNWLEIHQMWRERKSCDKNTV